MKYKEIDNQNKVYQAYPVQLTKFMNKTALEQFMRNFTGYKRADIMIKGDGKGREKIGKSYAIFIKHSNKMRRKEDKDITMRLSDFLLGQVILGRKRENISLLKDWAR